MKTLRGLTLLLLILLVLAGCSGRTVNQPTLTSTAPPTATETAAPTQTPAFPTPFPEDVLNPFAHILGPVPVPDGWRVEPCEGQSAFLCVFKNEETAGYVELLLFPLAAQTTLVDQLAEYGLTPGQFDTEDEAYRAAAVPILEQFAAEQLASAEADRQLTYGDSWRFIPLETELVEFGRLPGLVYGFVSLDQDDAVLERYITYVTFDAQNLYLIVATSDPAAVSPFSSDADLETFALYLRKIVAGLNFPSPIFDTAE